MSDDLAAREATYSSGDIAEEITRLRKIAASDPLVDGTEWGAKWSDGGYCPASPRRSEEFARKHATNFGTRPIRREVGPWVYADTGEVVDFDSAEERNAR